MEKKYPTSKNWEALNAYKSKLELTQQQREILFGGLLGDLSLRKIGKFSRLVLEQKNKDYLFHLYEIFKPFVRTPPKQRLQKRLKTSESRTTWYFSTISHSAFDDYYDMYYPQGRKLLPSQHLLNDQLTAQGLAYWFMDDGSKHATGYTFSTACFSIQEHNILLDVLATKFDLTCNLHGSKYKSIYVPARNQANKKFKQLVQPFLVESMKYKL